MTGLVRKATLLSACGLLAAASAFAAVPSPSSCTVPCAVVVVGHNAANTLADPYGTFVVVVKDATNSPLNNVAVKVDFSGCCTDIKLANTQLGTGVVHAANAAFVTGTTDVTGTVTFVVEGAASQGGGPSTGALGTSGCATITATPSGGSAVLLTNGVDHPTVIVSTPDENGAAGTPGVESTDLSVYIADKNAYTTSTANYRQRSDFDFHLPAFNCSAVFNSSAGFGDNLGDLGEWVKVKNAAGSLHNGPFPVTCP
jgi:hypothetical protein